MTVAISNLAELSAAAEKILAFSDHRKVFLFYGDMGAGKTTLIKELCKLLNVSDLVSSPTFSIVNEYLSDTGPVYHFDFYRLKKETEALDLGYEDYIDSGSYCFIEWPEKIQNLLPTHVCNVTIAVTGDSARQVELENN